MKIYQPGDDHRSCESLKAELLQCEVAIEKLRPKSDKTAQNVACAVSGAFLVVPWFFMDLKNADKTELEALIGRHDYLRQLAVDRGCVDAPEVMATLKGTDDESTEGVLP